MKMGENIKKIRKLRKLTQGELAAKANISRSYLGDLECDRYNPSIDTLSAIADALNVDIYTLLNGESQMTVPDGELSEEVRGIARDLMNMSPRKFEMFKKLLNVMSEEADEELKK